VSPRACSPSLLYPLSFAGHRRRSRRAAVGVDAATLRASFASLSVRHASCARSASSFTFPTPHEITDPKMMSDRRFWGVRSSILIQTLVCFRLQPTRPSPFPRLPTMPRYSHPLAKLVLSVQLGRLVVAPAPGQRPRERERHNSRVAGFAGFTAIELTQLVVAPLLFALPTSSCAANLTSAASSTPEATHWWTVLQRLRHCCWGASGELCCTRAAASDVCGMARTLLIAP